MVAGDKLISGHASRVSCADLAVQVAPCSHTAAPSARLLEPKQQLLVSGGRDRTIAAALWIGCIRLLEVPANGARWRAGGRTGRSGLDHQRGRLGPHRRRGVGDAVGIPGRSPVLP
jgi:hypothetical protein